MKTFEVIKQDVNQFQIYDPTAKRIVTIVQLEADAISLKTAMDDLDIATINNLFFLTPNMRSLVLQAMAE